MLDFVVFVKFILMLMLSIILLACTFVVLATFIFRFMLGMGTQVTICYLGICMLLWCLGTGAQPVQLYNGKLLSLLWIRTAIPEAPVPKTVFRKIAGTLGMG